MKKNAILIVDYTNTLRSRGMGKREAILHAGPVRLRTILMTTFADELQSKFMKKGKAAAQTETH